MQKTIVWFRKDLRLHDNPALYNAAEKGTIIPIFIWSKHDQTENKNSEVSLWWLHHSLLQLEQAFQQRGISLIIREGDSLEVLTNTIEETKANAIYFNERYEPTFVQRDKQIITELTQMQIDVQTFHAELLYDPYSILNLSGEAYKVFTPFYKKCLKTEVSRPFTYPKIISSDNKPCKTETVDSLQLLSKIQWHKKFHKYWTPGEKGAINRWKQFTDESLIYYKKNRDYPSNHSCSNISPHLAWGDISVKAIWYSLNRKLNEITDDQHLAVQIEAYKRQLVWRDFGYHQLIHFPAITEKPLRAQYNRFPWRHNEDDLLKWKKGMTGYPFVDAGMRELWETGFIHNRVRMVAASFLVKHLLIPWTKGAEWFEETLIDFDRANNAQGWQWTSGCGLDSAPYFRIFNPITQSEKFDKDAEYIKRWVPELAKLPTKYIHQPWLAPKQELQKANIVLGETYPEKIIDHTYARNRALAAYEVIK